MDNEWELQEYWYIGQDGTVEGWHMPALTPMLGLPVPLEQ